jgi:hypothetical protein
VEKAGARRALDRLESLLRRVRAFAQAQGLKLQTAASERGGGWLRDFHLRIGVLAPLLAELVGSGCALGTDCWMK